MNITVGDIKVGSISHGKVNFFGLSDTQISECMLTLEKEAVGLPPGAALQGHIELFFACRLELAMRAQVLPEPPSAVCWEHVDGQDPVRLSFSILVF